MIPSELRTLADTAANNSPDRVARFAWNGQVLWVKKAIPAKSTGWHRLQNTISKLIPLAILRPTVSSGGAAGLELEAARIRRFSEAGITVPQVLGVNERWILLEDLGDLVEGLLKRDDSSLEDTVADCTRAIARLHKAGLAHGRAKLNDLVRLEDGSIGFIDFEENLDASGIPLAALQARDLWLFSCSLARFAPSDPEIIGKASAVYFSNNDDEAVHAELLKLLRVVTPVRVLLSLVAQHLKGDVLRAYLATVALGKALS